MSIDGPSIKLVASDLDGTLFGPDHEVSPETASAVRAVASLGVEVVIATGRSHWSAASRLDHLGCLRWMICSNGATVYDFEAGEVVERRILETDQVGTVIDDLRRAFPTVGFAWESPEGVFHTEQWLKNRFATDSRFEPRPRPTRDLRIENEAVLKLMVAHDELTEYAWLDAIGPSILNGLSVSTSGASFVEVTAAEANKGDALRLLCARLGVDQADTIAFGDHSNDLGMLGWAGTGYAMANAHDRVLAAADATAPHHGEHGVAHVLNETFGLRS